MEAYSEVRESNLFQAFREEGNPTNYGVNHISAKTDVFIVSIVTFFVGIGVAFLIILPGFRGKEQLYVLTRTAISLAIGFAILLCNFGCSWEYASISAFVPYKTGLAVNIRADIRLNLGLRGFNVTLKDDKHNRPKELQHETIYYNERFSWEWNQGRFGFGPDAGKLQREYMKAQKHGLPLPILWIAEYFTIDGEGIRFGRYYRLAGWYTHIVIWFAFALWLLTNVVFHLVIQYGALLLILTGKALVFANILYCNIRNPLPLEIPFESVDGKGTVWLKPSFSWCYYLNLANGIVCIILGVIAVYADLRYSDETAEFFGVDVLQSYEDFFTDVEEEKPMDSNKLDVMTRNVTYVGLRKRAPISSRLSRLQRATLKGMPTSMLRHKPDNLTSNSHLQHDLKDDPEAGSMGAIGEVGSTASLRKKVRPEAPVYQNFIRESFAPVEEEAEN